MLTIQELLLAIDILIKDEGENATIKLKTLKEAIKDN